jgi:hypothetical protein
MRAKIQFLRHIFFKKGKKLELNLSTTYGCAAQIYHKSVYDRGTKRWNLIWGATFLILSNPKIISPPLQVFSGVKIW